MLGSQGELGVGPRQSESSFFALLSENAIRDDDFSHGQVFGHLESETLSAAEAAEYLEVPLPTLRRYVQAVSVWLACLGWEATCPKAKTLPRALPTAREYALAHA